MFRGVRAALSVWVGLLVVGAMLAPASIASAQGWSLQTVPNPKNFNGGRLASVSCASSKACTAVGSYTESGSGFAITAFAERWNGSKWSVQGTSSPGDRLLTGISCPTATACIAVGIYEAGSVASPPVAELWNGRGWKLLSVAVPTGATNIYLDSVSCTAATACTAIGTYDTSGGAFTYLAERFNGTSWSQQSFPAPAGGIQGPLGAPSVSCASATSCVASGGYYTNTIETGFSEAWNGKAWSVSSNSLPVVLEALSCSAAHACTAVGQDSGSRALAERWNGTSWSQQPTAGPTTSLFAGVSCTSATACTAVGAANLVSNNYVDTLAEFWNGSIWSVQSTVNPPNESSPLFNSVSCTAASTCFAVGTAQSSNGTPELLIERET